MFPLSQSHQQTTQQCNKPTMQQTMQQRNKQCSNAIHNATMQQSIKGTKQQVNRATEQQSHTEHRTNDAQQNRDRTGCKGAVQTYRKLAPGYKTLHRPLGPQFFIVQYHVS